MEPSIWTTADRDTLAVSLGVDPSDAVGQITRQSHGWAIAGDGDSGNTFPTMYEAANVLAGVSSPIEYKDYLLAKGEDQRTVFTTAEQIRRITTDGAWKMISASAPRQDDVN